MFLQAAEQQGNAVGLIVHCCVCLMLEGPLWCAAIPIWVQSGCKSYQSTVLERKKSVFQPRRWWQWVTSAGAALNEYGMQALVPCWQKCIANGDDCWKTVCCSWDCSLLNGSVVLFVLVVVSMGINMRHCFWSNLHTKTSPPLFSQCSPRCIFGTVEWMESWCGVTSISE